jgi:quercetin dioxygenase-like cupin family protein
MSEEKTGFNVQKVKGIDRLLVADGLDPERLRLHLSEIAPGTRSHPPHIHAGVEAFFVLEGEGVVEVLGERHALKANEGIILDPGILHGLENTGTTRMRYLVIISKP